MVVVTLTTSIEIGEIRVGILVAHQTRPHGVRIRHPVVGVIGQDVGPFQHDGLGDGVGELALEQVAVAVVNGRGGMCEEFVFMDVLRLEDILLHGPPQRPILFGDDRSIVRGGRGGNNNGAHPRRQ